MIIVTTTDSPVPLTCLVGVMRCGSLQLFDCLGLMGVVLLAAIAAARVAQPTGPWPGIILLLTHRRSFLPGHRRRTICRSGADAPSWWIGFALFRLHVRGPYRFLFPLDTKITRQMHC